MRPSINVRRGSLEATRATGGRAHTTSASSLCVPSVRAATSEFLFITGSFMSVGREEPESSSLSIVSLVVCMSPWARDGDDDDDARPLIAASARWTCLSPSKVLADAQECCRHRLALALDIRALSFQRTVPFLSTTASLQAFIIIESGNVFFSFFFETRQNALRTFFL